MSRPRPLDDRALRRPPTVVTQRLDGLDRDARERSAVLAVLLEEHVLGLDGHPVDDEPAAGAQGRPAPVEQDGRRSAAHEDGVRRRKLGEDLLGVPVADLDLAEGGEPQRVAPRPGRPDGVALDPEHPGGGRSATAARPLDPHRPASRSEVPEHLAGAGTQLGEGRGPHDPFGDEPVVVEGGVRQAGRDPEHRGVDVGDEVGHARSLTTRERRQRALLVVHTGDGKGKTTAAMGLALRAWARGWSVGVVQFVKSGRWPAGEKAALLALGRLHERTGEGAPVAWYQAGLGRTALRPAAADGAATSAQVAQRGWATCRELLARQAHDLLVLDELSHPVAKGWIALDDVVTTLVSRPGHQHVVVTGRDCPDPLLEVADLVTRMDKVRHPFDTGTRGQRGIEW